MLLYHLKYILEYKEAYRGLIIGCFSVYYKEKLTAVFHLTMFKPKNEIYTIFMRNV